MKSNIKTIHILLANQLNSYLSNVDLDVKRTRNARKTEQRHPRLKSRVRDVTALLLPVGPRVLLNPLPTKNVARSRIRLLAKRRCRCAWGTRKSRVPSARNSRRATRANCERWSAIRTRDATCKSRRNANSTRSTVANRRPSTPDISASVCVRPTSSKPLLTATTAIASGRRWRTSRWSTKRDRRSPPRTRQGTTYCYYRET